jgi:hypothetical protein
MAGGLRHSEESFEVLPNLAGCPDDRQPPPESRHKKGTDIKDGSAQTGGEALLGGLPRPRAASRSQELVTLPFGRPGLASKQGAFRPKQKKVNSYLTRGGSLDAKKTAGSLPIGGGRAVVAL